MKHGVMTMEKEINKKYENRQVELFIISLSTSEFLAFCFWIEL